MMYFHLLEHYNCWSSIMYASSSTSTTDLLELFQNNTSLICKKKILQVNAANFLMVTFISCLDLLTYKNFTGRTVMVNCCI